MVWSCDVSIPILHTPTILPLMTLNTNCYLNIWEMDILNGCHSPLILLHPLSRYLSVSLSLSVGLSVGDGSSVCVSPGWGSKAVSSTLYGHGNSDLQRCVQVRHWHTQLHVLSQKHTLINNIQEAKIPSLIAQQPHTSHKTHNYNALALQLLW